MPVLVTGASSMIGRHAVGAFLKSSPQVRAYISSPEREGLLRQQGAKVAMGEVTDVDNLAAAMTGVHTVCHLVGSWELPSEEAYEQVNLASTQAVLRAAKRAEIKRLLFLSYPGAAASSTNVFLRMKGLAEEELERSSIDHVIIRATRVYGPEQWGVRFGAYVRRTRRPWIARMLRNGRGR